MATLIDEFCFSSHLSLEEIRYKQDQFASERNWEQYHTPRNILLAMVGEVGELSELFQWRGEVKRGLAGWTEEDKVHLGEELSDVLIYLVRLSERCHVNLPAAVSRRFELMNSSSTSAPADSCKSNKIEQETETPAVKRNVSTPTDSNIFTFTSDFSLEEIRAKQIDSSQANGSSCRHQESPRNILLALVTEMGKVSEIFQWRGEVKVGLPGWTEEDKVHLGDKLSDVLIYLIQLSDGCHVNLPAAVTRKFELNARKYPADKAYGSSLKYTAYVSSSEQEKLG